MSDEVKEPRRPLTPQKVETAKPRERDYKLADTGGLYLFVSTSGHRSWRLKYRFGGKERRLLLGSYPDIGLKRARELRDDAKYALRDGLDPGLERQRARHARKVGHENTFEQFAREWHASQVARWKPVHADDVMESMENNLFGEIGGFPVDQIDEGLLLAALRKVEARGAIETAHRLRQRAERVFKFAGAAGVKNSNPAVNVRDALKPVPPKRRRPALTDVAKLRTFIRVRVGNIQVGDQTILEQIFPEARFNSWAIGEVHIFDRRIVPNGRRDEFEANTHYANLVNQLSPVGRDIARRCRTSSTLRSKLREFEFAGRDAAERLAVIEQGAMSQGAQAAEIGRVFQSVARMRKVLDAEAVEEGHRASLEQSIAGVEAELARVSGGVEADPLDMIPAGEREIYRRVFNLIYECSTNRVAAKSLVDKIIQRLT